MALALQPSEPLRIPTLTTHFRTRIVPIHKYTQVMLNSPAAPPQPPQRSRFLAKVIFLNVSLGFVSKSALSPEPPAPAPNSEAGA